MSGSTAAPACSSVSWSTWMSRHCSPTRANGAPGSPRSALDHRSFDPMSTPDSLRDDNFSQAELDKFGALASRWWDPQGPQKALHALTPPRLAYVGERVTLAGAQVLDIGCGGGLLSEAMAGEGARVTAVDLAPELIKVAGLHALES